MNNCGIDLNFLESNNELVIKSLVNILDSIPLTTSYQWYKGIPGKSYGAFVKEIGSGDRKGLKAFILPKATKLLFTELDNFLVKNGFEIVSPPNSDHCDVTYIRK